MAPRKKVAPAASVPPPAEPQWEEVVEEVPVEDTSQSKYRGCLIASVVIVVLFFMAIFMTAVIGVAVWYLTRGDDGGDDDRSPATPLVEQIDAAMTGPDAEQHALYMSKVCRGVAGRLKADFGNTESVYDQRSELTALTGHVGYFATSVDGVNKYPDMPMVIHLQLAETFGELPEGGPVTPEDEPRFVAMWERLADAFAEVAR